MYTIALKVLCVSSVLDLFLSGLHGGRSGALVTFSEIDSLISCAVDFPYLSKYRCSSDYRLLPV